MRADRLRLCSATLILTVALLTPSIGLMTLPIPDDQPLTVAVAILSDCLHVGKRFTEDHPRVEAGITPSAEGTFVKAIWLDLPEDSRAEPHSTIGRVDTIRGPPLS